MHRVFLGMGSNLGDRASYILAALQEISKVGRVHAVSSIYETEPFGYTSQPDFLNLVVDIETSLDPPGLFRQLKTIEGKVGRNHTEHMKAREIDIDILLYEGLSYADKTITVPHAELHRRRFVLEPLNEIAAHVEHPVFRTTIAELFRRCEDRSRVVRRDDIREFHQLT